MATPRLFPPVPLLTPLLRTAVVQAADMVDAKVATNGDGARHGKDLQVEEVEIEIER
jgi:hypothetical protein